MGFFGVKKRYPYPPALRSYGVEAIIDFSRNSKPISGIKGHGKILTFMFFELFPILPYRVTVSVNVMLLRLYYEVQHVSYSRRL